MYNREIRCVIQSDVKLRSKASAVSGTLFFHHLTQENKQCTIHEVLPVLQPMAPLYIADWGKVQLKFKLQQS